MRMIWFRDVVIAVALAMLSASTSHAQTITREIVNPRGDAQGLVLVRFFTGGQSDAAGKGLGAFDAAGNALPHRVLAHDPRGETVLCVKTGGSQAVVRYGHKPVGGKPDESLRPSVILRVYDLKAVSSLDALLAGPAPTNPVGLMSLDEIGLAYNPFGRPEVALVIEGKIDSDGSDAPRLVATHSGAGAVEIDGRVVIRHDQPYMEFASDKLAAAATPVKYDSGHIPIRFASVTPQPPLAVVLGRIEGDKAVPFAKNKLVRTPWSTLGSAAADEGPAVGFDARQVDQLAHGEKTYTRFQFSPIAPGAAECLWTFGDGTTVRSAGPVQHVFVSDDPAAGFEASVESAGRRAAARFRSALIADTQTIENEPLLTEYATIIGQAEYAKATGETIDALAELVNVTEQPALIAPLAEQVLARGGGRDDAATWGLKYTLATSLAGGDPARAATIFADLARKAPDSWHAACAAAENLDLLIHRLDKAGQAHGLAASLLSGKGARERSLLIAKQGDALRAQGKLDEAKAAYLRAQNIARADADPRKIRVLDNAYRETALGYLEQNRLPAMRDELFQWEADFPMSKIDGDLPLLVGRYHEAVGDDRRAAVEYAALLEMNPLRANRPELAFRLAQCLRRIGDVEGAAKWFEVVTKEYPNSPFAAEAARGG